MIHVRDHIMGLFSNWFWCSLLLLMYLRLLKKMTSPTKKLKLDLLWGQFYLLNLSLLYTWWKTFRDHKWVVNSITQKKKNQDIVNVMDLVKVSKQRLQVMREDEWSSLLTEVSSFCTKNDISILNMDETFVVSGRLRRNTQQNTNLHHYHVELFYTIIDMQFQDLNNHFLEVNTDLLLCMACLNPSNLFVAFDKEKLIRLAKFYPSDFSKTNILALGSQLQNYIFYIRIND